MLCITSAKRAKRKLQSAKQLLYSITMRWTTKEMKELQVLEGWSFQWQKNLSLLKLKLNWPCSFSMLPLLYCSSSQPFWHMDYLFKYKYTMDYFAMLIPHEQLVEIFQKPLMKDLWNSLWTTRISRRTTGGPPGPRWESLLYSKCWSSKWRSKREWREQH